MIPPEEADKELQKPEVNEMAAIVNSHFLQSPYEGKDWDSVRKDIIAEATAYLNKAVVAARIDELEKLSKSKWADLAYDIPFYLKNRPAELSGAKDEPN